jgi:hypothetical protein
MKIKAHRTLPTFVALYGRERWSFTLKEEHKLRTFEYRVLRKILGPKSEEVKGGWRSFRKDLLHVSYSS